MIPPVVSSSLDSAAAAAATRRESSPTSLSVFARFLTFLGGGLGAAGAGSFLAAARLASSSHTGASDCTNREPSFSPGGAAVASGIRTTSLGLVRCSTHPSTSISTLDERSGGSNPPWLPCDDPKVRV